MAFYAKNRYRCIVTENGVAEKESTGNPYVYIRFIVKATANGKPVEKEYHRELQKMVTDKTIPWLAKELKALGLNVKSWIQMEPTVQGGVDLKDQEHIFECDINDRGYEDWRIPFGGGDGNLKEVKKLDKAKFADLHKKFGAAFTAAMLDDADVSPY